MSADLRKYGIGPDGRVERTNRPGLPEVAARLGVHAGFKSAMLRALSAAKRPGLGALNAREDEDWTIAFLDAVALYADIHSFHNERHLQEAFLRTATERYSVRQLGRLIGHELGPGKAAETMLAFELETGEGAPAKVQHDGPIKVMSVPGPDEEMQTFETVEPLDARQTWSEIPAVFDQPQAIADARTHGALRISGLDVLLKPGAPVLVVDSSNRAALRRIASVEKDEEAQEQVAALAASAEQFAVQAQTSLSGPAAYVFNVRAQIFAHNAPAQKAWDTDGDDVIDITSGMPGGQRLSDIARVPDAVAGKPYFVPLDTVYRDFSPGDFALFVEENEPDFPPGLVRLSHVAERGLSRFDVSGKVTEIAYDYAVNLQALAICLFRIRRTTVFSGFQALNLARQPKGDIVSGAELDLVIDDADLGPGRRIAVSGVPAGEKLRRTEFRTIARAERFAPDTVNPQGRTRIELNAPLAGGYPSETVLASANIVRATQGVTTVEVLGAGDASQVFQAFTLRSSPVTHLSAATESGVASTLEIRVDGVVWDLVEDFSASGPDSRVYTTQYGEDGRLTVRFGDGRKGARLPTGTENVVARLRVGQGAAGNVAAGSLSLLADKPLGVKAVTNPLAASGGADGDTMEEARRTIPTRVTTLGRVVSLRDYEDFAAAFSGVAKAQARWVWTGTAKTVFLTVAGARGEALPPTSTTRKSLAGALSKLGDPLVAFRIESYEPLYFAVRAGLKIDPAYEADAVIEAAASRLRAAFSFDARALGAAVFRSDVIAVLHETDGVVAVDLDGLYLSQYCWHAIFKPNLPRILAESPTTGDRSDPDPAQLIMLDPNPVFLDLRPM